MSNQGNDDDDATRPMFVRPAAAAGAATQRRPQEPAPAPVPASSAAKPANAPALGDFVGHGDNALIQAATPLLVLAGQLRVMVYAPDAKQIQQSVVAEVHAFEEKAKSLGCSSEAVITARYLLCTFLDESVMSTPWGEQSGWRQRSLLSIFHRETWGGEKFFQILDRADPARHMQLLELIFVCLSLGFAGKYHIEERGAEQLAELRRKLYHRLAEQRGQAEPDLSPHWKGVRDTRNPIIRHLPPWVAATAAVSLVIVVFLSFYVALGHRSSPIENQLAAIGLDSFSIKSDAPPAPKPAASLKQLLAADESAGMLTVEESPDRDVVTVSGALFDSGSATIGDSYRETLKHIGAALDQLPGRVLVIGHTDDAPLRSIRYSNNVELSRARALEFVHAIGASMSQPSRLEWSGVGSSQPRCLPPSLPASRACNRRVEIVHLHGN